MQITLLTCYEQGHQPLSLASPLAVLRGAGLRADAFDLSVQAFPNDFCAQSSLVAISTPMHTALRLGAAAAERVREANAQTHICLYGAYAWMNAELLLAMKTDEGLPIADSIIGGEYEQPLLQLAQGLAEGRPPTEIAGLVSRTSRKQPNLERPRLPVPDRSGLPAADNYAMLRLNGHKLMAGYTESTRGCLHLCRHCPVVPVYGGRFFAVPVETVLADVSQQVRAGVRHITFGDPDFLNGPGHALKVAREIHCQFPDLTFDFTTKVEHIVAHTGLIAELRRLGAAFVVSAFESTSENILQRLRKGHTLADMERALQILEEADLPLQATWVPFTPWTTLDDYLHMLQWIRDSRLIQHVAPVQLAIRLLIPPYSALLTSVSGESWLGALDAASFGYRWEHPDPRMDQLQKSVAVLVEKECDGEPTAVFRRIEQLAYGSAGKRQPPALDLESSVRPPRLTEDWFC